jgi:iron complex transport system substrate-binding protein
MIPSPFSHVREGEGKLSGFKLYYDMYMSIIRKFGSMPFVVITFFLFSIIWLPDDCSASLTVKDFRGQRLILKKPVERIVCLIESSLSGLFMLGAEKRIVGISTNVYQGSVFPYYAALDQRIKNKSIPAPGNWDFVNIESVIALKPDLVIIWADQRESIKALEDRGIAVYGVFVARKEDVYKEMLDFGIMTGTRARAEELISYTKSEIERFRKRIVSIPELHKPAVYYMWAQGNLETSCGGSTVNDLIELAGGRNVCASIAREHAVVKLENVLAWNPEVIVMWYNEKKNPADIMNDPQWKTVRAVKSRQVHEFPEVFLCDLWTLKFHYAVKMVAKWSHPSLFQDIDLEKEKMNMMKKLYGREIAAF